MNLNIVAPINNLSYGIVSANIVHSLTKLGHQVSLFPVNPNNMEGETYLYDSIEKSLANAEMPDFDAPCIRIWHQFNMSQWAGHGRHVGFPIFELDTFNAQERHHLSRGCDTLFVCSKWAIDVCKNNNVIDYKLMSTQLQAWDKIPKCKHISVVPLGVNTDVFFPSTIENRRRKTTIFLNVGKWEVRKGHDKLCDYFNTAFSPNDDVELWMMTESPFLKPYSNDPNEQTQATWEAKYKNTLMGHKIRFIPRVGSQAEVSDIMRQADCGIFPARAEGWNLDLLEMMACGKMVIATDYSGHTEFCTKENSRLVPINGVELAYAEPWFKGQGNWAVLNDQGFIDAMREIHEQKQDGKDLTNEAGITTGKAFSWENTAQSIVSALT